MLTSSNQYLRPEYLTPLPTTLDAKKSPLALLAQTCSQIGADNTSNSKLLQTAEKITKINKFDTDKEKVLLGIADNISNVQIKNDINIREKSITPDENVKFGAAACNSSSSTTSKASPNSRSPSSQSEKSPCTSPGALDYKTSPENNSEVTSSLEKINHESPTLILSSDSTKPSFTSNILSSDRNIKDLPLGTFKPGLQPTSSPYLGGYSGGYTLPVDILSNSLIPQNHTLKSGVISSYLGYGRIKTQESVCRDPYCAGCGVSSQLLSASSASKTMSCTAGCVQCDHSKPSTSAGYMNHGSVAAYAHAQLAALTAASHLPYVCNWISSDATYCGKRFSNSEELLSHLRTHTSAAVTTESSSTLPMLNSTVLPPSHSFLPRTYPTPPLSPLTTARYHPYNKPSMLHPAINSSLNNFTMNHPSVSPYLSPYSLYTPRLGTTPGMHP